jgi:hypothetical protein
MLAKRLSLLLPVLLLAACQTTDADSLGGSPSDLAATPVAAGALHAQSGSKLTLVYVSAKNCPPCDQWSRAYSGGGWMSKRQFLAMPEAQEVELRQVETDRYQETGLDKDWPEDLQWARNETNARVGAPRFILILDGKIVANSFGYWKFTSKIVPEVKRLVKEKTA